MRFILAAALVLSASPAFAKDNTLTPKEAADGWLLLFDGDTNYGWHGFKKTEAPDSESLSWHGDGKIEAKDGTLSIDSTAKYQAKAEPCGPLPMIELQYQYQLQGTMPMAVFQNGPDDKQQHSLKATKEWSSMEFKGLGNQMAWFVPAAFTFEPNTTLLLKNVKLRPVNLKPLSNGKDLTGWKEFPGKKSKFTVNAQGEINIKDGPGDLQTEGKYENFILQLECISNGKNLNSGVFFRCRPNEYQNGYEVQIRNQFTKEPTQEYTLEEYDPQTHKLLAKKKEKFTAVDYGTGAIYRRQPARKEVTKDGEWFTLTILAYKNHYMTWVNGIQVADFVDNRPPNDNARNGYRQEAGHISLQGHDPTTDLSFRNIRIAEIK